MVPRGTKALVAANAHKSLIDDSGNGAQVCLIRPLTEVDVIETITHIWRSRCIDIGEVWGNDFVPTGEGKRREVAKGCPKVILPLLLTNKIDWGTPKKWKGTRNERTGVVIIHWQARIARGRTKGNEGVEWDSTNSGERRRTNNTAPRPANRLHDTSCT